MVCGMRYAVCECGMSFLLQICEVTSKFLVNSMAYAFAFAYGSIDPLTAFAFAPAFAFAFAFGHMVYMES